MDVSHEEVVCSSDLGSSPVSGKRKQADVQCPVLGPESMDGPDSSNSLEINSQFETSSDPENSAERRNSQPDVTDVTLQKGQKKVEEVDHNMQEVCDLLSSGTSSRELTSTEGRSSAFTLATGDQYFRNTILDEVLSEKKMAILHSPEVVKFLQSKLKDSKSKTIEN